jgi:hypothetical protein
MTRVKDRRYLEYQCMRPVEADGTLEGFSARIGRSFSAVSIGPGLIANACSTHDNPLGLSRSAAILGYSKIQALLLQCSTNLIPPGGAVRAKFVGLAPHLVKLEGDSRLLKGKAGAMVDEFSSPRRAISSGCHHRATFLRWTFPIMSRCTFRL